MNRSLTVVAALVIIASGLAIATASYGQSQPKPPPPFVRPPDDEYLRQIADARVREEQLLAEFAVSDRDPRSLPRLEVQAWNRGVGSLTEAIASADLIFVGTAEKAQFSKNPSGGLPVASVTIQTTQVLKGSASPAVVLVQLGGPVPQPNDTVALAQLDTGAVVLAGDEVVIFGTKQTDGSVHALPAAGIYFVTAGSITPGHHNRFGSNLSGMSLPEFLTIVREQLR